MQTMVRDFSFDQKETIKSFFTESEWDCIYESIRESLDHEELSETASKVEDKIHDLFRS